MNQREHYDLCIRNGCSPALAEMLATRTFPGTRGTDRAFMQGRHLDGSQFEGLPPIVGRQYVAQAEAAGVNPTGKYYSGTLARFPGDPEAWVDSVGDIKRLCEQRGWGATGAVNITTPEGDGPSDAPYRVADDIVDEHVGQVLEQRPELLPRALEIREEVQGRLSGVHG